MRQSTALLGKPDKGTVYIIWSWNTKLYKIGHAIDSKKRIKRVQQEDKTVGRVTVIHTIEANYASQLERHLHERFRARRIRGEWFALEDADLDYLFRTYPPK